MFDAAAAATAAEVNQEQVAQEQAEAAVSGDGSSETQESTASQDLLQAFTTYLPVESRQEIVFVDPTVLNYQALLSGMDPTIEVVMFDGSQDGIEQMAAALAGRTGIDVIHLISHGAEGQLSLGTGTLTQESMTAQYTDELATIRQSLSESANIMVYGSEFTEGQAGQDATTLLSQLTGADVTAGTDPTGSDDESVPVTPTTAGSADRTEVVFVDGTVADYEVLVSRIQAQSAHVEVIVLDSQMDGVQAITAALSRYEPGTVDAVHILSHGIEGGIQVGSTWINQFSLQWQADIIASWGQALTTSADIMLWGCNVASTAEGQTFVNRLAEVTGADVAASTDATGHALVGGDWQLEYATAQIETQEFMDSALSDWVDVLAISANGTATSSQATGATSLTWSHTVASGTDRALFVTLAIDGLGAGVNSVTYGGVALTQVGRTSGNHAVEIWRLTNPTVGTGNIVVSLGATTDIKGGAVTYNGVDQTTPTGTYVGATGTGTTASVNVSSATGALVLDITNWDNNPGGYTTGAGQSAVWDLTNSAHRGVSTTEAGATTVTMSSTVSASNQWEIGAVSINASVNVSPTITSLSGDSLAYSEGAGAVVIEQGGNALVADSDSANFDTGTLTVSFTAGSDSAEDVLSIRNQGTSAGQIGVSGSTITYGGTTIGTFTGGSSGSNLVIALNSNATPTSVTALVKNITYQNTDANAPTTGARTVRFALTDGDGGTSANYDTTVTVSGVNDAPINTVPGAQTTNEDTSLVFSSGNGNQIAIADDAGGNPVEVTVSVTNGTLTLAGTTGLTFTTGDGTTDTTMTFRGTVSAINTALNGLSYNPTADYSGGETLTVRTVDSTLVSLNLDSSLKGSYTFESTSALGTDTSPLAGYTGTVVGATSVYDATRGNVLSLDGNDYVQFTGHFGNPANVTLAAWVNLTARDTLAGEVISLGDSITLQVDDVNKGLASFIYNGSTWASVSYNTTLAGTGWHHVAVTFSDSANLATLYLDGSAVGTTTITTSLQYTLGANSFIGKQGNGNPDYDFNGKIDDARIYNRALTASEIAVLASDVSLVDTDTVAITVNAVNDGPAFTSLNGTPTFTEGGSAVVLDSTVTITDTELTAANNFNGATLTLSRNGGANSQDVFSGSGTLSLSSGNVVVSGTTIGTYTNSSGTLVMTFNSNATNTLVNQAMQQIAYSNSSDAPPSSVQVNWTFSDGNSGSQGTGGALTATGSVTVTIAGVNDAPVLADTALSMTVAEDAGAPSGAVGSLISVLTGGITEPDGGSTKGIAITGTNETNGTWYYTTNGGTTWTAVGTVSNSSALLLADNGSTRLYFAPGANYNGTVSNAITLRAWDQTTGSNGTKVSLTTSNTVLDSMSSASFSSNDGTANWSGSWIESDASGSGATTGSIDITSGYMRFRPTTVGNSMAREVNLSTATSATFSFSMPANLMATGQVLVQVSSNGGSSYTTLETITSASATGTHSYDISSYMASNTRIRFYASVTDSSGIRVDDVQVQYTTIGGGSSPYSTATDTIDVTVNAVNDAPVLADTALTITVAEDAGAPSGAVGATISSFTGGITDMDSGASKGIAITGTNETNGTWYYTTNGGTTWMAVGSVSNTSALLLADNASTRLYFAPSADYNGTSTAALTLRAWDQTSGTAGTKVTTASNGGTTAFSSATDTVDVTVTAVNDAPTDLTLSANTIAENATNGTVIGTVTGTDPDTGDTKSYSFTDSAGGRFAINSSTGQITVANGSLLNYEAATSHSVTVRVTDSGGLTYDETFTINLTNVNETPTDLALSANTVAENAANGTVVGSVTGTDPDSGDTKTYSFTDSAGGRFAINSSTGQITVADGSLLNYEAATSHNVTVRVTDAGGLTYDETFTINVTNVNEAPTGADATVTINEDSSHILTTANLGFSDVDAGDSLSAVRIDTLPGAGSLTLSGVAVTAGQVITVADITAGNFVFTPAADANGAGYASFTFSVRDSNNTYDAAPNTLTVDVTAVNDAPIRTAGTVSNLTLSEDAGLASLGLGGVTYSPGGGADESGQTLTYAVTAIPSASVGDVFLADGTTQVTIGSYTLADIQGMQFKPAANASGVTAFQFNVYDSGGTANGGANTISQFILITVTPVNDAPTITNLSGDSLAYTEGDGAVVIEQGANALVADVDSSNFDTGTLTVSFTAGSDSAEDILSIRNQGTSAGQIGVSGSSITYGGTTMGTFTGGSSGSALIITLNSSATPTAVTALIRNITYENTDTAAPTTGARTVRYTLTDGEGGTSANYDTTVTVSAVNDAPVLDNSGVMTFTSITEDDTNNSGQTVASILASAGGDRITDADSGASEGIAVTSLTSGSGTWQYNMGSGWTTVGTVSESSALLLRATDSLRFVPDGEGADSGSITFRAWDQTSGSAGSKVATGTSSTVLDQFNSTSFSSNNGTQNWAGAWIETDAGGSGAAAGSIQISSNQLRFDADTVGDNIAREVDLSNTTGSTLTFSYNNQLTGADRIEVRVSSDGGTNYTTLANGTFSGSLLTGSGSASFDISAYASSNTRIQFIVTGTGGNDRFYVDNVQISSTSISATGAFSSATETASIMVTAANDAPTDLSLSANTVVENAANGTVVGTVSGTDPDNGDTKTYSFTDSAGGRFAINSSTGQITVANGSLLNYESATSHSVTVRVTDSGGLTYDETFTINLTNVNETPTDLALSANTVAENAANGTVVGSVTGTDPDTGDTKSYSFTDNAGGRFAIDNSTGQITVADGSLLNYESATSHTVTVRVTDAGGLTYDETFTITVTNVNEAPTGADATVTINEDSFHTLTTANFGFSDVDAGDSLSAVRIDSLPGAGALRLSGVAVTAGQVISAADITAGNLVFTPTANANGTSYASFTFSVRDSNNAYDSAPNTLTVNVTAINDSPVITNLSGDNLNYAEGDGAQFIEQFLDTGLMDVDSANFDTGTLTVAFVSGSDAAEDVLAIHHQGTAAGQIGVSGSNITYGGTTIGSFTGGNSGANLVVTFNNNATRIAVETLLMVVTYTNTDTDAPTSGVRTVRFVLTDGDGGTSANHDTTVTVSAVNDAPVLADTALTLTVAEDAGVPSGAVGSAISAFTGGITDVDSGAVKGIAITGTNETNGTWYYTTNGGTTWTAVGTVSNTSALLLADNANTRLYFAPSADYNGTSGGALTLRAWDQTSGTAGMKVTTASNGGTTAFSSATDTIDVTVTAVNDAPVITPIAPDVTFVEGGLPQVIDATGTIADVDSANLDGGVMTVSISANGTADDRLQVGNFGAGPGQVGLSGSNVTYGGTVIGTVSGGTSGSDPLVITFNTSATPMAVQEVYRSIQFTNVSENPSTATRTLTMDLTDGDGGAATPQNKLVYVQSANDVPVLTFGEGDKNFTEGALAVMIDALPNVSDLDSTNFDTGTLTITISANPSVDDRVELLNTGMGAGQIGVSGTNVYYGGTLIGTQAGGIGAVPFVVTFNASADAAIVGEVMANIRFWVAGDAPSTATRTVEAVLTDGDGGTSLTASKQITVTAVNDAPVLDLDADNSSGASGADYSVTFAEGGGPVSLVDSGDALLSDVDSGSLTGLTVTLSNQLDGTSEVLSADTTGTGIVAVYDSGTGVLTLSGSDTAAHYQQVLRTIQYNNTSNSPDLTSRTLYVVAEDGVAYSNTGTVTVTMTAANDAPTDLTLSANTVAENAANGTVVGTVTGTDPDTGDTKTYSFTDSAGGRFAINSSTGEITVANGSLLNYETATSHSVTVRVTDSGGLTYDETFTINLTNVNETPTDLALSANTVAENAANGTVVGTVTGTDPDSGDTKTYGFTDSAGGRFSINNSTGVITVANSSLLDYESATSHSVIVRVTDAGGLTYDETFTINVTNVNEAPTGADATITINEDTSHALTTANFGFSDVDAGDSLNALRIDTLPGAGSLTLSGVAVTAGQVVSVADITAGNLVFAPAADANGTGYASFTFSVRDSGNLYDPVPNTLTFDVTTVNDAPVNTVPGAQTVAEDMPLALSGISVNDVDGNLSAVQLAVGNGTLTVSLSGGATISAGTNGSGTLALSGSQAQINAALATLTYQGTLNFMGSDTLTITSTDTNSGTDVDTVAITVTAVDDPTIVTGGTSGTGTEDTTVTGTLTATDAEGLSDGTVFSVSTGATNGTASIDPATGLWSYTPNADFNGSDSFTVTITDDAGNTSTQVISVTVTPVVDLTDDSLTTAEDTAISANVLTGMNGATADSFEGTPVLTSVTQGANGSVTFLANGTVTYTPNANFAGTDSFTYTITSGGVTETATVTVTVTAVDDPTSITGDTSGSGTEDTTITGTLTATDAEGLSDGTVFSVSTTATNGTASIDPATGLWSYTPNPDWNGSDSFTVTITDDAGNTSTQVISVTVTPVNDAPLLVTNTGSTVAEGGTDTIDASELAVTDVEQTSVQLTYTIGTGPLYGRLELTTAPGVSATSFTQADIAANRLIYIHDGSESANDSFTFTVNDGAGGSLGPTTVTLTITPVNDTPTISSDGGGAIASLNVAENVSVVTIVTGADVDLPAQALAYSISGGVDQALFTINAVSGALSFTAPPDFEVATDANGDNVYVVQVQVVDSQGASTTQTIQVTVTDMAEGVPPPPVVPPILLTPTPPLPSGEPTSGPGTPPADEPATVSDPTTVPPGTAVPQMVGPPVSVVPLTLVPPSDRPVERVPEELRKTEEDAKDRPLFFVNDDQGRLLYSVLPVEPAPTLEPEPPETTPSVSDLLLAKLDEMAVSLEQAVSQSQERHELMARVAAVTGTTLSVGFVAWALRSGAILASMLATMPAWQHFDPLPVVKLTRNERARRRDEAMRAQQEEAVEFKGLGRVLDEQPPLKRTAS